mgnify:CR=1 FL=1
MMLTWTIAALLAGLYCIARAVVDLRLRKYAWGLLGIVSAAIFLLTPLQTHAVKMDLLPSEER